MQEGLLVLDGSNRGGDSLRSHTGRAARSCNLSMSEKDLDDSNERYRTKRQFLQGNIFGEVTLGVARVENSWRSLIEKSGVVLF